MPPKIDLEKFKTDPAYEGERSFLDAYFEDFLVRKQAKLDEDKKNESPSIFDSLFGAKK